MWARVKGRELDVNVAQVKGRELDSLPYGRGDQELPDRFECCFRNCFSTPCKHLSPSLRGCLRLRQVYYVLEVTQLVSGKAEI